VVEPEGRASRREAEEGGDDPEAEEGLPEDAREPAGQGLKLP